MSLVQPAKTSPERPRKNSTRDRGNSKKRAKPTAPRKQVPAPRKKPRRSGKTGAKKVPRKAPRKRQALRQKPAPKPTSRPSRKRPTVAAKSPRKPTRKTPAPARKPRPPARASIPKPPGQKPPAKPPTVAATPPEKPWTPPAWDPDATPPGGIHRADFAAALAERDAKIAALKSAPKPKQTYICPWCHKPILPRQRWVLVAGKRWHVPCAKASAAKETARLAEREARRLARELAREQAAQERREQREADRLAERNKRKKPKRPIRLTKEERLEARIDWAKQQGAEKPTDIDPNTGYTYAQLIAIVEALDARTVYTAWVSPGAVGVATAIAA